MKRLCYFLVLCASFWWLEYASAVDWLGDVPQGETINFCFNTLDSAGEPVAIVETGIAIDVYEDGNSTPLATPGTTLTNGFNSVVGLHNVALVATSGNSYEPGKYYSIVIDASTSATADGVDIVGRVIGRFRCVESENVAGTPTADITYVDGSAASSSIATAADIADAVHDEALSGHTTAGTAGKALADIETDATAILADTGTDGVAIADGSITAAKFADVSEPSGVPGATLNPMEMIAWEYFYGPIGINKTNTDLTNGEGEMQYYNQAGTKQFERDVTKSGTVTTKDEVRAND